MKVSNLCILYLILLVPIISLTGCSKTSYSTKQITKYLKEKYELEDIELFSEEQLEDIDDKAKDRHIYTFKAGDVEFTVQVDLYRYDNNIAYTKRAVSNYHRKVVISNDEIKSKIEGSGFDWRIEDENYVIEWNDYDQIDKLVMLFEEILQIQKPITDIENKYVSDSYAHIYVNIMNEKKTYFTFARNVSENITYDEIYESINKTYYEVSEWQQKLNDFKTAVMGNEEINTIINKSGFQWDIENENYVIFWDTDRDIHEICQLVYDIFETDLPIIQFTELSTDSAALIVEIEDTDEIELVFPSRSSVYSRDEIYEKLREGSE